MDANDVQTIPRQRVSLTFQIGADSDVTNLVSQSTRKHEETPPTDRDVENKNGLSEETKFEDGRYSEDDPAVSNGNDEDKQSPTKFTTRQKIIFLSAALASFANWLTYSLMSVFFPIESKARGMSQTVTGLVFSTFAISYTICSPIWGKILPVAGARFLFLAGAFVTGSCNVLFGFVADMPTQATFTSFCFLLRIVEGMGSSACLTATYSIVVHTFPNHVGTAVSIIEMMGGLSFAVGPPVGGLLYDVGGFKLPFFVLGGTVLLISCVNCCLLPEIGSQHENAGSLTHVLTIPAIWVSMCCMLLACVGFSSLDPTLTLHLKQLGYNVVERSVMFGSFGFTYAATAILWGRIADRMKSARILMILGLLGSAVSFSLIGPSPFLPPTKVIAVVAIPSVALFLAMIITPSLLDMLLSAEWYGLTVDLGLTSIISGLWNSAFSAGAMLGPIVGGGLVDQCGFDLGMSFIAAGLIVYMVFFCLFGAWEFRCGKGRRRRSSRMHLETDATADEETKLLQNEA